MLELPIKPTGKGRHMYQPWWQPQTCRVLCSQASQGYRLWSMQASVQGWGWTLRVTQGRFIICAAMCQPHCVVDSIVRLATRSGHLATILQPTKPAPTMPMFQGRLLL